jgi:type I restriction enzyme R subunit
VADFCNNAGADVAYRNHDFHLKLTKGISYEYKMLRTTKSRSYLPIDYQNPENNAFWCVNQFSIGKNKRRPDIIIYINGIPLVLLN